MKKDYRIIKERREDERPREKLLSGNDRLTDEEWAAILLRTGTAEEPVTELAARLINELKSFNNPFDIDVEDLMKIKGIGPAKACTIIAALELGRSLSRTKKIREHKKINAPWKAAELVEDHLRYELKEHFYVLLLDTKNHLLCMEEVSKGSLNASIVHPREAFKKAVRRSANAVIFIHNHPSGDVTPSREDIITTKRLVEAGDILGIKVLDHIIIGEGDPLSMKEENYF